MRISIPILLWSVALPACSGGSTVSPRPPAAADAAAPPPITTGGPPPVTGPSPEPVSSDAASVPPAADARVPAADAPASTPPSTTGRHAALVWGYGEERPTPSPGDPLMPLDLTMKARLEAKGLIVDPLEDKVSTAADVMGKALIVISNSVDRRNLFDAARKPKFRDVAVPAI